jgi:hypothetical protein
MATPIESFTAVLLQLNLHYKTRVAVKLTGIPDAAESPGPAGGDSPSGTGAGDGGDGEEATARTDGTARGGRGRRADAPGRPAAPEPTA